MQKIFSSTDAIAIEELKEILEEEGIACEVKNEFSGALLPIIGLKECTPELWIQNDEDAARALDLLRDWKAPVLAAGPGWKCAQCGEEVEPQFSACWKCGTPRASVPS